MMRCEQSATWFGWDQADDDANEESPPIPWKRTFTKNLVCFAIADTLE